MFSFTGLQPKEDVMLNRFFKDPAVLRRFSEGPAGPFLESFGETLLAQGYSIGTCRSHLSAAAHLSEWAVRRGVAIADFDEGLIVRFARHLSRCRCRGTRRSTHKRVPFRAHQFLRHLREAGIVAAYVPVSKRSAAVVQYGTWMREHRGLAATTIRHALPVAQALLDTVEGDPLRLDAAGVRSFVHDYIRQHAPASAMCITSIVRCALRYWAMQEQCSPDLIDAVPKVPTWRLAKLPQYLRDEDVERIIEACNRPSPVALRDRAMLLLLARLGLRACEVVALRLGDIDWSQGRLRIIGKGWREARLPLPQDAGDAVLAYLEAERPATPMDFIFLTARAPIGPIRSNGLRSVVCRAIERAGVQSPSRGTHILRHSVATRWLREGATLDAIGSVLRHRDVNTTASYAKVDVDLLRQIAQPWPSTEVSPC